MLLIRIQFGQPFYWRLKTDDPLRYSLARNLGWELVSPILYAQIAPSESRIAFFDAARDEWIGSSGEIALVTEDQQAIQNARSDGWAAAMAQVAADLVVRLRHFSGQATLPKPESLFAIGQEHVEGLPSFDAPTVPSKGSLNHYHWRTAVTSEHINLAVAEAGSFQPRTHETLFLDAIAAHRDSDYRRTILYAAMSAEIAFGSKIDEAYANILTTPDDGRFRVITRPLAGGAYVSKDPIYDKLRSRADFKVLINELALYVFRRSLLSENEALYLRAIRMYNTRNQLAHTGALDESDQNKVYNLDQDGSMAVLKTALELFSWLGERADFELPTAGFKRFGDPPTKDQRTVAIGVVRSKE